MSRRTSGICITSSLLGNTRYHRQPTPSASTVRRRRFTSSTPFISSLLAAAIVGDLGSLDGAAGFYCILQLLSGFRAGSITYLHGRMASWREHIACYDLGGSLSLLNFYGRQYHDAWWVQVAKGSYEWSSYGFEGLRLVLMAWLATGWLAKIFGTIKIGRTGSWNYDSAQISDYDEHLFSVVASLLSCGLLPTTSFTSFAPHRDFRCS